MPKSNLIFIEGEAIDIGSAGESGFEYEAGTAIPDSGSDGFVFTEGNAFGNLAGTLVIEGVAVDVFETSQTLSDWQDARPGTQYAPNSVGWGDANIQTGAETDPLWIFGGYSTDTETFSLCFWTHDPSDYSSGFEATFENSAGNFASSSPISGAFDGESNDSYGTRSDGDTWVDMAYGTDPADGAQFELTGGSYTIDLTMDGLEHASNSYPGEVRARGPNTDRQVLSSLSTGTSITIEVNV